MHRRFCAFLLIAAASAVGQPMRNGPSADIAPIFARQNVSVVTFNDGTFQSKLGNLLPTDLQGELTPLLPYLVIIENHSQLPIVAIRLRYERTSTAGQVANVWVKLDTQPRTDLGPGASLIGGPRSDLVQALWSVRAAKRPDPGLLAVKSSQIYGEFFDSRRVAATVVSLDSIVFANGGVVGPDRYDSIGENTASAAALKEILAKISDPSVSDKDLDDWLKSRASQSIRSIAMTDGSINQTLAAQIGQAQAMRAYLAAHGRPPTNGPLPENPVKQLFRLDQ